MSILLFFVISIILSTSFVSANVYDSNAHGVVLDTSDCSWSSSTDLVGMNITARYNVTLINVTRAGGVMGDYVYLYNQSHSQLVNASIVNNVAEFNYNLTKDISYLILLNGGGTGCHNYTRPYGGPSTNKTIIWRSGVYRQNSNWGTYNDLINNFKDILTLNYTIDTSDSNVTYYAFENNANDSWGGRDGTEVSTPTYSLNTPTFNTSGNGGSYSLEINGDLERVDIPENFSNLINGTNSFSISVWANETQTANEAFLFDLRGERGIFVRNNAGTGKLFFYISEGATWKSISAAYTINTWTHYVFSYNTTDMSIYKNSIYINSTAVTSIDTKSLNSAIGNDWDGGSNWSGLIDEWKFYNKSLNSSEISNEYNYGNTLGKTVSDITPPYFNESLTNKTFYNHSKFIYEINATDADGNFDTYGINSTTYFQINDSGYLTNKTSIPIGNYSINVTINDTSGNLNFTIIWVESKSFTVGSPNAENNFRVSKFINVSGKNFTLSGEKYTFIGVNAYYLADYATNVTYDDDENLINGSRQYVTEILDKAQSLGINVLRTWIGMQGGGCSDYKGCWNVSTSGGHYNLFEVNTPGNYSETMFAALDWVISEAGKRDIRIMPVFVNNWDDYGGMRWYAMQSPTTNKTFANYTDDEDTDPDYNWSKFKDQFYTDANTRQYYKNFINYTLNRTNTVTGLQYKNDPTIFAWMLANEPRAKSNQTDREMIKNWTTDMVTFIKSLDSNHLVALGIEGFGYNETWGEGTDMIADHNTTGVDFATYALHPNSWNYFAQRSENDTDGGWVTYGVSDNRTIDWWTTGTNYTFNNRYTGANQPHYIPDEGRHGYDNWVQQNVKWINNLDMPVIIQEVAFPTTIENNVRDKFFQQAVNTFFNEGGDGFLQWNFNHDNYYYSTDTDGTMDDGYSFYFTTDTFLKNKSQPNIDAFNFAKINNTGNTSWVTDLNNNNFTFYYNVTLGDGIENCSLYINRTNSTGISGFILDQSNTSAVVEGNNSFSKQFESDFISAYYYTTCCNSYTCHSTSSTFVSTLHTITLTSPSSNTMFSSTPIYLNYTVTSGLNITKCELEINNTINQTNTSISYDGSNNFFVYNPPDTSQKYDWRVKCTNLNDVVRYSDISDFIYSTGEINATLFSPANITTSITSQNYTVNISSFAPISKLRLYINNSLNTTYSVPSSTYSLNYGYTTTMAEGYYEWYYNVTDIYGNSTNTDVWNVTIDTTKPYFTHTISNKKVYNDTDFVYDINATDSRKFDSWKINDTQNFTIDSNGILTNNTELINRTYTIKVTINDTAGNINSTDINVSVMSNNAIVFNANYTTPLVLTSSTTFANISVNVTDPDNDPISWCNFSVRRDGTLLFNNNGTRNGDNWTSRNFNTTTYGHYNFTVWCNDNNTHSGYSSFNWSYEITAAPKVSLNLPVDYGIITPDKLASFNATVIVGSSDEISSCSLWLNSSGTWSINKTIPTINNTGIVLDMRLDKNSTTQGDSSGNGNEGNVSGATFLSNGKIGSAYTFDGTDDYIDIGNSTSLKQDIFTISYWMRIEGGMTTNSKILEASRNDSFGYGFTVLKNNSISFDVNTSISGTTSTSTILINNTFYHITGVYNGTLVQLYLNGILEDSKSLTTTEVVYDSKNVFIGAGHNETGDAIEFFNGTIDDVKIFNRSLNSSEVMELYNYSNYIVNNSIVNFKDFNFTAEGDHLWNINCSDNSSLSSFASSNRTALVDINNAPVISLTIIDYDGNITDLPTFGQRFRINATITDSDNDPIPYANLTITSSNGSTTINNANGTLTGGKWIWDWQIFPTNSLSGAWYINITTADNNSAQGKASDRFDYNNSETYNKSITSTLSTARFNNYMNFTFSARTYDYNFTSVNLTLQAPNGTAVKICNSLTNITRSTWQCPTYTRLTLAGNWTMKADYKTFSGNKATYIKRFSISDDMHYSPISWTDSATANNNQTFKANISIWLDTNESESMKFSLSMNDTAWWEILSSSVATGTVNNSLNSSNALVINVTIRGNSTMKTGVFNGTFTINRTEKGDNNVSRIPIQFAINPPAGDLQIFQYSNKSQLCDATNYCNLTVSMLSDGSTSQSYYVNNTGGYALTDCYFVDPGITGATITYEDLDSSIAISKFNLAIASGLNFKMLISRPNAGTYDKHLNIMCDSSNQVGDNDSLLPTNRPLLKIIVTEPAAGEDESGGGGGGAGPPPKQKLENVTQEIQTIVEEAVREGRKLVSWNIDDIITAIFDPERRNMLFKEGGFILIIITFLFIGAVYSAVSFEIKRRKNAKR